MSEPILYDDMTQDEKMTCYESYVSELKYEWGDNAVPMTFDEFNKEWEGYYYEL